MTTLGLEVLDHIPAGCTVLPVTDDDSAPHTRCGEFAIVNVADREPAAGGLFVIRYSAGTPRERCAFVELLPPRNHESQSGDFVGWRYGPLTKRERVPNDPSGYRMTRMVDGPLLAEELREKLVGRVIGIGGTRFVAPAIPRAQHRP
jgi:hypothetical protein